MFDQPHSLLRVLIAISTMIGTPTTIWAKERAISLNTVDPSLRPAPGSLVISASANGFVVHPRVTVEAPHVPQPSLHLGGATRLDAALFSLDRRGAHHEDR